MNSIRATFKRRFLAGIIVLIPITLTVLIIKWLFTIVDSLLEPLYQNILGYHVPGIGFVSTIILIFIIGFISTNVFGKKVIQYFEKIMLKIPVFKSIYVSIKQLVDAFSPESKSSSFKKFVIVEYPRTGVFAFGFLTKECALKKEKDGSESCMKIVYIPTNLIYFGEIAIFRSEEVYATHIPVEEGIKIILSGGIAAPPMIPETKQ
ncbi:MAG: DUF502 domain-containing protein [Nitrospirota bacterium]